MADKNLSLGTLFTGQVDATFIAATNRLVKVTKNLTKQMNGLNRAVKGVAGTTGEYSRRLKNAAKDTTTFGQKVDYVGKQLARVRGVWGRLSAAFKVTAAYGIAATALYKVVAGFQAGVSEIINFDQALKNLQAITRATDSEIFAMGKKIKEVATTTKFSTTEVAQGMVLLGQAGFTAAETMQAIGATTRLATGTLSSMATTADLLTTTVRAFNMEAIGSNRVADVMANAINRSKLTLDKLRIAFNFVGAAAAQTGLSLEQTAASMMVLANHGLRASTIGTGLRQVLSRLLAPNRRLRDAFEQHGIVLDEVNPRVVGFEASLLKLAPIIWDHEKGVVDMGKAYTLFGLRGAQAAAVLIKAYVGGDYDDMLQKVYEFGSAALMASKQQEGLAVMWKNLADSAKVAFIALGDAGLTGIIRFLVKTLKSLTDEITRLLEDPWGRFIMQTLALSAALVATAASVGALFRALRWLFPVIKFLGVNLNWVLIGFATLAGYLSKVTDKAGYATRRLSIDSEELKSSIAGLESSVRTLEMLKKKYEELKKAGKDTHVVQLDYINTLKAMVEGNEELKKSIDPTIGALQANIDKANALIDVKLDENLKKNEELIRSIGETIKDKIYWWGLWEGIIKKVNEAWNFFKADLKDADRAIAKPFEDLAASLWDILPDSWKKDFAEIGGGIAKSLTEAKVAFIEWATETGKASDVVSKKIIPDIENMNVKWREQGDILNKQEFSIGRIISRLLQMGASIETVNMVLDHLAENAPKVQKNLNLIIDPQQTMLKNSKEYLKLLTLQASLEKDEALQIQVNYLKRIEQIKKLREEREKELKSKPGVKGPAAEIQAAKETAHLITLAEKEKNYAIRDMEQELAEQRINIAISIQKRLLEIQKQDATASTLQKLNLEIKTLEVKNAEDIFEIRQKAYEQAIVDFGENHEKTLELKLKALDAELAVAKKGTKEIKAELKEQDRERKLYIKYQLENTKRSGDEYVALLQEAYEKDIINLEDYIARRTAAVGSFSENLRLGFEKSKLELQTFGELTQQIGEEFPETFGNDLTGALWDFAEGTKTAKEAMADFAKSTIRWLGEMITKWAIMNAITGMMPAGGGGATPYVGGSDSMTGVYHKGGIVGVTPAPVRIVNPNVFANARRFHSGLRNDEVPAILQKGEEVIPKGGSRDITVNLTNKTGTEMGKPKVTQRMDGSTMILDVVLDAANRNKGGFADSFKGIMRR